MPDRHTLLHAGQPGDSPYMPLSGKVKVSLHSAEGKEAILGLLGSGDVFQSMAGPIPVQSGQFYDPSNPAGAKG